MRGFEYYNTFVNLNLGGDAPKFKFVLTAPTCPSSHRNKEKVYRYGGMDSHDIIESNRTDWRDDFCNEWRLCEECNRRNQKGFMFCKFHHKKERELRYRETGMIRDTPDRIRQNNRDNRFKLLSAFLAVDIQHSSNVEVSTKCVLQKLKEWRADSPNEWYLANIG